MRMKLVTAAALMAVGSAVWAGDVTADDPATGLVMTYAIFEDTVHHIDLDKCPAEFADQEVFCRLTIQHDRLNLVVFSNEGDSPMVAVREVDPDRIDLGL